MKVDICSLLLLDESKEVLIPEVTYCPNDPQFRFGQTKINEKSISGSVLQTKKERFVLNIEENEEYQNKEFAKKKDLKSVLSVPLLIEEEALGVINLYTKKKKEFSRRSKDLVVTLASQAAVMIRNAKLYQKIK